MDRSLGRAHHFRQNLYFRRSDRDSAPDMRETFSADAQSQQAARFCLGDISSFSLDGQRKYIEVKTTGGDAATDLFISANELEFSRVHPTEYCLYRVFEYDISRNSGKLFVHPGPWSRAIHWKQLNSEPSYRNKDNFLVPR